MLRGIKPVRTTPASEVLILTDNPVIREAMETCFASQTKCKFTFRRSAVRASGAVAPGLHDLAELDVKREWEHIAADYDLLISAHCKQLFPPELVHAVRCVNLHPGFNPFNRGWYPQVFSIINKLPIGATIHEIDEELDHGQIIAQKRVDLLPSDTSETLYERVIAAELDLFATNFDSIITGTYVTTKPVAEGNVNLRSDYVKLCTIDMERVGTFREFYDLLRALTHRPHWNAFFEENGRRIYLRIETKPDVP